MVEVRASRGGSVVRVHLKPGGRRDAVLGERGGALLVEVRARPEKGAANDALLSVLADVFGLRAGELRITSGASSRRKSVAVPLEPRAAADCMEAALSRPPRK